MQRDYQEHVRTMREEGDGKAVSGAMRVLVADDEITIRKTLALCLEQEGHTVVAVAAAAEALAAARRQTMDIAFVDLRLGADDGLALIPALLADSPWLKIIVITAYASVETAVEAMRRGAVDYIPKPFTPEQVRLIAARSAHLRALERENTALRDDVRRLGMPERIESRNPAMQRLIEMARKVSATDAIVLIRGESGTGKSMLARAIHQWSPRSAKPFGVVSCPAVPADLLESELFGHRKGAFTGALRDQPGRIAACEGGTLFLDEIADIPPAVQAKLLRFVQEREYERLGDPAPRQADLRVVVATNADIAARVADGRFREDLFYRINVITLEIPPLRDHPEDILPLAREFLVAFNRANHAAFRDFDEEACHALTAHPWPGNIRELRNAVERAVILASGELIGARDLTVTPAAEFHGLSIGDAVPLERIEEEHIRRVLATHPLLQEAAAVLGIDQATLWRKRKRYGID